VNESAVLLAGDLAWPLTVLIIVAILLASQRGPIGRLIDRIKSLKYPGGEAELTLAEGNADVISTLVDALSRGMGELAEQSEPTRPAAGSESIEPIQNREPIGDFKPLPAEQVTSLVMLGTRVGNLLSELAYPPAAGGNVSVSATVDVLRHRGVLDDEQAAALHQTLRIADEAARGAMVPPRVAQAVQNAGTAIERQLALLRTVAAAKFEDHVLDMLRKQLPDDWSVDIDRAIPWAGLNAETPAWADAGLPRHARVDALVMSNDRNAVLEVRARLQPGADGQIDAVREWLEALPSDLPVLLVMLGERLLRSELERIRSAHEGIVEVLLWDKEASSLIPMLRGLLR